MRKIFLFISSLMGVAATAQTKFSYHTEDFHTPLSYTIHLDDEVADYDPRLQLIKSAAPLPATTYRKLKAELDARRAAKATQPLPATSYGKAAAPAPTLVTGFEGNIVTQGTPNDNDMAISDSGMIVSVVNQNLTFINPAGGFIKSASLSFFAKQLGTLNRTYDPRVVYDPDADRFIVVFLQGSTSADTRIITAFSKTNDPTKEWHVYAIPGNTFGDSSWSDYPILSLSKDELFITVNRLKDNTDWKDGFIESLIWQVEKSKGYAGATLTQKQYKDIKLNGKSIWSICPVKGGSALYGPKMHFLSVRPSDLQNDTVFLHEISNTIASGSSQFSTRILRTDRQYGLQPNAIQPNLKKLQTNDARVLSAMMENEIIHYVANCIDTQYFSPGVYYGRISSFTWPGETPVITGKIIGYDSLDIGYPSVSYIGGGAADHSALITFSHVSPNHFPGTSAVYVDRDGNISGPVFVKTGLSNIDLLGDSVDRWGDYTGNQRKYNETGVCWVNGSYGKSNGNYTWIGKLRSNDVRLNVTNTDKPEVVVNAYPNPVAEYVTVDFEVEQTQFLTFTLSNIKGQLVDVLLRDKAKAGKNRFSFSTSDLPDGIYFLNINNNGHTIESRKIVVHH